MKNVSETAIICINTGNTVKVVISGYLNETCIHNLCIQQAANSEEVLELIDDLVEDGLSSFILISNEIYIGYSKKQIMQTIESDYPEVGMVEFTNISSMSIQTSLNRILGLDQNERNIQLLSKMSA